MGTRNIDDLVPEAAAAFRIAQADQDFKNKPFQIICVLRTQVEQQALYAQGRKNLDQVNALRKSAGMVSITADENKHPITWTMQSPHIPNKDGKSRAVDILALNQKNRPTWELIYYNAIGPIFEHYGFKWGVWLRDKTGKLYHTDKGHLEWKK